MDSSSYVTRAEQRCIVREGLQAVESDVPVAHVKHAASPAPFAPQSFRPSSRDPRRYEGVPSSKAISAAEAWGFGRARISGRHLTPEKSRNLGVTVWVPRAALECSAGAVALASLASLAIPMISET